MSTSPAHPRVLAAAGLAVASLVASPALVAQAGAQPPAPRHPTVRSSPHDDFVRAAAYAKHRRRVVTGAANFTRSGRLEAIDSMPVGAATGRLRCVYFFVHGRYVGNDGRRESLMSSIRSVGHDTVAVTYTLWRNHDTMSHPTGGHATVRYRLVGHQVRSLDHVPPYTGRGRHRGGAGGSC